MVIDLVKKKFRYYDSLPDKQMPNAQVFYKKFNDSIFKGKVGVFLSFMIDILELYVC